MAEVLKSLDSPKLTELIKSGSIGVIPTDTVYGLVCKTSDQSAVAKVYALKARNDKPGTVIAANIDQLTELGIKRSYVKAVEQFWPGAVSVVVPFSDPTGAYLRAGKPDIAVRIQNDPSLTKLLLKAGPLLTTSANLSDEKPVATIDEAQEIFGDKVDFYVDGGDLIDRQPSTVIRIIDDAIEILRQGAVKIDESGRVSQ